MSCCGLVGGKHRYGQPREACSKKGIVECEKGLAAPMSGILKGWKNLGAKRTGNAGERSEQENAAAQSRRS